VTCLTRDIHFSFSLAGSLSDGSLTHTAFTVHHTVGPESYLTQHSMSHTVSVLTLWPLLKDSNTVIVEMQSVFTLPLSGSITFVITVMHLTGPAHLED